MDAWNLIEPFDADNGELSQCHSELVFAMGVEWERFRQKLLTGEPFIEIVISDNVSRLSGMAERHHRFSEWHQFSDGWCKIIVGNYLV